MTPDQRWVKRVPSSWGKVDGEVAGQGLEGLAAVVVVGLDGSSVVVDRVVAAPQDPPVRGDPVVVELVAGVGEADRRVPADAGQLLGGQRFGRQDVVVDGDGPVPQPAQRGLGTRWSRVRRGGRGRLPLR